MEISIIINILGTEYTVDKRTYDEDKSFEQKCINGYIDTDTKTIVYMDMSTKPEMIRSSLHNDLHKCESIENSILRHEIIHAFLHESGLDSSSLNPELPWALNEEMTDWFAIQSPKIYNIFKELMLL